MQQLQAGQTIPTDIIAAETSFVSAQASLKNAQAKLDLLKAGPTASDLLSAQIAVQAAQGSLVSAQVKLDQLMQGATHADRIAAEGAVSSAEAQLASALAKKAALGAVTTEDMQSAQSALQAAQLNLDSARQKLDDLKAGPTEADRASATSAVAQAASGLTKAQGGNPKATDLALQQESLKQAQVAVQQAQADLDGATLVAPFDGIVGIISSNVGEMAATGTNGFLLLVDPTQMRVDVTVDETDVAKIQAGKPATITFDALSGRSFTGKVLSVSPSGTLTQGVVTYPVSISIDIRGQGPASGMTATTNIVIDQKENILAVPPRAVQRQGRDQIVNVLGDDGKPVQRVVRTGISSDSLIEIVDGVHDGDKVVIPGTTTRAPNVNSGLSGGGGGAVAKPVFVSGPRGG
jgi:HlyD family secretion protein